LTDISPAESCGWVSRVKTAESQRGRYCLVILRAVSQLVLYAVARVNPQTDRTVGIQCELTHSNRVRACMHVTTPVMQQ